MSCVHYQSTDPPTERNYYDGQHNRYVSPTYSPRVRTPEACRNGYYSGWRALEFQENNVEAPTAGLFALARGDPTFAEARLQTGRAATYKQEARQADALAIEKLRTRMKYLEDSNTVMQTRNHNLDAENKALASRLEEEEDEVKRLGKRVASLREELDLEKLKLETTRKETEEQRRNISANGTSTTSIVSGVDRGVQVWAVCMGCQRKLESCEKQPPSVTITKSELEVLEKDMQTLRDTIIAREEAWDKAMEREQNYRQQLTRLTTETITARHLSETRYEDLQNLTDALTGKESEVKSLQKDNLHLNKLIAKMHNSQQRGQSECRRSNLTDLNEKDQKFIEEVVRRVSSAKGKQKPKPRSACLERTATSGIYQNSPRDRGSRAKDQTGSSKDSKR